jgi:thioredoxin 1
MKLESFLLTIFLIAITLTGFSQKSIQVKKSKPTTVLQKKPVNYKVTFIELGSVRCIPCQKMQVVMKSIEKKYGKQVNVVFHDVWTAEGKLYGEQYKIEVIPVQIFLDDKGKEFYRHEGYFPEEELIKLLNTKGIQ